MSREKSCEARTGKKRVSGALRRLKLDGVEFQTGKGVDGKRVSKVPYYRYVWLRFYRVVGGYD